MPKRRKPFQTNILGFDSNAKRWGDKNTNYVIRPRTLFERKRSNGKGMSKFWPACEKCSRETGVRIPVEGYSVVEAKDTWLVVECKCHGEKEHVRVDNKELGANWWERENFLLLACRHIRSVFKGDHLE